MRSKKTIGNYLLQCILSFLLFFISGDTSKDIIKLIYHCNFCDICQILHTKITTFQIILNNTISINNELL